MFLSLSIFIRRPKLLALKIIKKFQRLILLAILLLGLIYPSVALEISGSDILLNIATKCINPKAQD
jgi:hypothetical protein